MQGIETKRDQLRPTETSIDRRRQAETRRSQTETIQKPGAEKKGQGETNRDSQRQGGTSRRQDDKHTQGQTRRDEQMQDIETHRDQQRQTGIRRD